MKRQGRRKVAARRSGIPASGTAEILRTIRVLNYFIAKILRQPKHLIKAKIKPPNSSSTPSIAKPLSFIIARTQAQELRI
jgi:hypothetical protein